MRLLQWLRYHADRLDDAIFDSETPFGAGLDIPWSIARRHAPITPIIGESLFGPGLLDDAVAFLECGPIGRVDLVMLMRLCSMNPVSLLRHDIDPAALIAARKTGVGTAAGHVIEHRDIFSDPDWIIGRQYDPELAHAQPLGLHT